MTDKSRTVLAKCTSGDDLGQSNASTLLSLVRMHGEIRTVYKYTHRMHRCVCVWTSNEFLLSTYQGARMSDQTVFVCTPSVPKSLTPLLQIATVNVRFPI